MNQNCFNARIRIPASVLAGVFLLATAQAAWAAAPRVHQDDYRAHSDQQLVVTAPGVLVNDYDPDGDPLTVVLVGSSTGSPGGGTINLLSDGSFFYNPPASGTYSGWDVFEYAASDGSSSSTTSIGIQVHSSNTAPVANDDLYSGAEGTSLVIDAPGLLANDTDADYDYLKAVKVTDPANGTLIALLSEGGFAYNPNPGFVGTDSFTYKANDGKADSGVATVKISIHAVNQAPVANNDKYSVPQDSSMVQDPGVLANDTDADGNKLKAVLVTPPANGTFALLESGVVFYAPNPGFSGTDTFTYKANDGKDDSNEATVTITVEPTNLPPVANNNSYSTTQDLPLLVNPPGLLDNDSDPERHVLVPTVVSPPSNGNVSLGRDGRVYYAPDPGFTGTDSFTYTVSDGDLDSNEATVTITVKAVNLPPVANADAYPVPAGGQLKVAGPGVLNNDSDPDGGTLSVVEVVSYPPNGALYIYPDGGFDYNPLGFVGTESFTYKVSDGQATATATVQLTVKPNQPPVANDDQWSIAQDAVLNVDSQNGVLDNDSDPEGHSLLLKAIISQPSHGTLAPNFYGGFTYTPDAGFSGTDTFTYIAWDGDLDSNEATVTIDVMTADVLNFYVNSVQSYGGSVQDVRAATTIEDGGFALRIVGNGWKKIDFPYTITEDTILEFDFQSMAEGEIHG
ncbi:MAG: Ig-like domain-containing protein, partial [Woeseiaceae bacterium]